MTLSITLDWLAFSFMEDTQNAGLWIREFASVAENDAITPRNGYDRATRAENGIVHMWHTTRAEMGNHVIIAGTALRYICEHMGLHQKEILARVIDAGGRISRIDLAFDLQDVKVSLDEIYQSLERGESKGTARTFAQMHSANGGNTIYVGSRQSEKFIRIYDKAAETGERDRLWTRFELETKGQVARMVATYLTGNTRWQAVFNEVTTHMVSLPAHAEMAKFYPTAEVEVGLPKIEKSSDREKWIETQVMPAVVKHFTDNPHSPAVALLRRMLDLVDKQLND